MVYFSETPFLVYLISNQSPQQGRNLHIYTSPAFSFPDLISTRFNISQEASSYPNTDQLQIAIYESIAMDSLNRRK